MPASCISSCNMASPLERREARLRTLILPSKQQEMYGRGTQNLFQLLRTGTIPRTPSLWSQPRCFVMVVFNVYVNKNTMLLSFPEELFLSLCNYFEFCIPAFTTVLVAGGVAKVKFTIYFTN